MYKKAEGSPRMTRNQASERYPDSYALMQMDEEYMLNPVGRILYVGDDGDELFSVQVNQPVQNGIVIEGIDLQRRYSLGGVIAVG